MPGVRGDNQKNGQERLTVLVPKELCDRVRVQASLRNLRVGPYVRQVLAEKMDELDGQKQPRQDGDGVAETPGRC
jgi:hypothetical protein